MELADALGWASERRHGVLITIRKDGRPQSSDILYAVDGTSFLISVTADRAKTHNMARDPRVVLHITDPGAWSYVSFDATATLSRHAVSPDGATSDALVAYYELVAGKPHDDWAAYRQAMVTEKRLVVTLTPSHAVGNLR